MRNISIGIAFFIISVHVLDAQEQMRYRDFELGSDLSAVAALASTTPSQAKFIHQRPAVIQDLEWRPRYFSGSGTLGTDPVAVVMFNFYNDQLFRIIVDYDRHRTEGMTETDMIDAITTIYGQASKPVAGALGVAPPKYGVPDTPVAVWGNSEYSATLLRVAYPESFRLVLAHTRLEHLARIASSEAVRMDADEAPQREIARRKKEADDGHAAREKTRTENRAVFKP